MPFSLRAWRGCAPPPRPGGARAVPVFAADRRTDGAASATVACMRPPASTGAATTASPAIHSSRFSAKPRRCAFATSRSSARSDVGVLGVKRVKRALRQRHALGREREVELAHRGGVHGHFGADARRGAQEARCPRPCRAPRCDPRARRRGRASRRSPRLRLRAPAARPRRSVRARARRARARAAARPAGSDRRRRARRARGGRARRAADASSTSAARARARSPRRPRCPRRSRGRARRAPSRCSTSASSGARAAVAVSRDVPYFGTLHSYTEHTRIRPGIDKAAAGAARRPIRPGKRGDPMQRRILMRSAIRNWRARAALHALVLALPFAPRAATAALGTPVFEWQRCPSHYCETGWYASPAVSDVDRDGVVDVLWGGYTLLVGARRHGSDRVELQGARVASRMWPGVAVADLDGDGAREVDRRAVRSARGARRERRARGRAGRRTCSAAAEMRTLAVADLDRDGSVRDPDRARQRRQRRDLDGARAERRDAGRAGRASTRSIPVPRGAPTTRTSPSAISTATAISRSPRRATCTTWPPSRTTARRCPRIRSTAQARTGARSASTTTTPSTCAATRTALPACRRSNRAPTSPTRRRRSAISTATAATRSSSSAPSTTAAPPNYHQLFQVPMVFNADRTRWAPGGGFDWTTRPFPTPAPAPLSIDYEVIESAEANPVLADLDGDGVKEILHASYDGRVHAFWASDSTEHGAWPFDVNLGETALRFASEPVVADLDGDGQAEVVFTTWTAKGSNQGGDLFVVERGRQPSCRASRCRVRPELGRRARRARRWPISTAIPTIEVVDRHRTQRSGRLRDSRLARRPAALADRARQPAPHGAGAGCRRRRSSRRSARSRPSRGDAPGRSAAQAAAERAQRRERGQRRGGAPRVRVRRSRARRRLRSPRRSVVRPDSPRCESRLPRLIAPHSARIASRNASAPVVGSRAKTPIASSASAVA